MGKSKLSLKFPWCGFWTELRFRKTIISKMSFHSLAFMCTVSPNFRIAHITYSVAF